MILKMNNIEHINKIKKKLTSKLYKKDLSNDFIKFK